MQIKCPHCGERALQEYIYAGAADISRPDSNASMQQWHEFVHLRSNPRGPTLEYWQHVYGCRDILIVKRDTQTHEIYAVTAARTVKASP